MKKQILLSFIFYLSISNSIAQDKTLDSLKLALKNAKHDTTIVGTLFTIAETIYFDMADSAVSLWMDASVIAEKNLQKIKRTNPSFTVFKSYLALCLNDIGFFHENKGNIPKALEYYDKSLKIQEEIGNKDGIATSLNNIGMIYDNQGDISKAIEYVEKSLRIQKEIGDKYGAAISISNIGSFYVVQNNISKAIEYFNNGLKLFEEISNKRGISSSLHNLAEAYRLEGKFEMALEHHRKSLKISEEIKDKPSIATNLFNLGSIYLDKKNEIKALEYAIRSMKISQECGSPKNLKDAALLLTNIYKASGKHKLALENYELYIQMRDSVNNETTHKASITSQLKYEYEKKATADSVKVAEEKKVVAAQLKQEKTQRFALYGGLALVALFGAFMFNRLRISQKQKHIIELKEKETQQQKHIIEEKHKEITDSINYAERIQRSFLATEKQLSDNLKDYFVFFKPKDVVSGDFYWSAKLSNGNFALATADSTGHGVPGAIMSLLNVTSLEQAIEHCVNPADILNSTRQRIIERLKKDGSEEGGKDGMDCSLLVFDFAPSIEEDVQRFGDVVAILHITAANNPVWIISDNEMIEIKPDKMPVGKSEKQDQSFTTHTIKLRKGDSVYTLTDGFPDQFGGVKGKKFMSRKLKELLLANVHLPITQQKELLDSTFKNWVGDLEQVDDVTVIGIRV